MLCAHAHVHAFLAPLPATSGLRPTRAHKPESDHSNIVAPQWCSQAAYTHSAPRAEYAPSAHPHRQMKNKARVRIRHSHQAKAHKHERRHGHVVAHGAIVQLLVHPVVLALVVYPHEDEVDGGEDDGALQGGAGE